MKNHVMNLNPSPFEMIKEGNKTIELRLYDEKRKKISIGDIITFTSIGDTSETLNVIVTDLFVFEFNGMKMNYLMNCVTMVKSARFSYILRMR